MQEKETKKHQSTIGESRRQSKKNLYVTRNRRSAVAMMDNNPDDVDQHNYQYHVYHAYLTPAQREQVRPIVNNYVLKMIASIASMILMTGVPFIIFGRPLLDWPKWQRRCVILIPSITTGCLLMNHFYNEMQRKIQQKDYFKGTKERYINDFIKHKESLLVPDRYKTDK